MPWLVRYWWLTSWLQLAPACLQQTREGRAGQRVEHEADGDQRQRPAHRAPRGFEQRDDEDRAHHHVERAAGCRRGRSGPRRCRGCRAPKPRWPAPAPSRTRARCRGACKLCGPAAPAALAVREDQEDQPQHEGQVHAAVRDFLQQPEARRVVVEHRQQRAAARPPAWRRVPPAAEKRISGSNFCSSSCRVLSSGSAVVVMAALVSANKKGQPPGPPRSGSVVDGNLLQQAGFLVEALGTRVEGDARALDGVLLGDELALGVAGGQLLLRGVGDTAPW
jgi:hypothetical protein